MARRYGRLWSIFTVIILFLVIVASIHTLQPLRKAIDTNVVVEPESKEQVLQDQKQAQPVTEDKKEPETQQQEPDAPEQEQADNPVDVPDDTPEPSPAEATEKQDEAQTTPTTSTSTSPTPTELRKVIVMGKLNEEDTNWVNDEMKDWQNAIYVVDLEPGVTSPTGFRTEMNKAREAMAYLTYIVDHYPKFPDVMAFIHPHRRGMPQAWHTDARGNDAVNMLRDLKLETVVDRGYVNLRCNNEVGCPDEVQPFRDPPDPEKHAEHAYPFIYANFFNVTFATMQEKIPVVATPCCAQFAISRAQILKKPKHEYVRYRRFLEETHYDDATSGRVMEYMWHIIFGRDAVHCENMFECWCAVYGRCFRGHGGGMFG